MNTKSIRRLSKVAVAIAAITAFTGVNAAQLEEIVVTAQKRAESLQDVPISITTIDGSKIEQASINSMNDLSAYVPNLMLTENAVATSIVMRGVGPGANQSFEQSVGLYVDGVHLAKGRQARTGLFDLERVEVLRGPQGILFGKNTLAGAINVTSATPRVGDEFAGKVAIGVESNNGFSLEGNVSGSITDTLAVRFAYKDRSDDGYLPNSILGTSAPSTDETLLRFAATWQPTDNTTVKLKHAEGEFTRVGAASALRIFEPTPNLALSNALLYGVVGGFFPDAAATIRSGGIDTNRDSISLGGLALAQSLGRDLGSTTEKPEGTDTTNEDTSLNIDIDFGDGYTFTSVTGIAEYEYEDGIDADFLPVQFIGRSDISEYDQKSQEFRIASDPSKRFSFITGAYIEESTQTIDRIVAFDGTFGLPIPVITALTGGPSFLIIPRATTDFLGFPFGVDGFTSFRQLGRVSHWEQKSDSWAVFFQGEYQINDKLTITGGLRYTEEDKEAVADLAITTNTTGLANPNSNPFLAAIGISAFGSYAHNFDEKRTTDQLMPALSLEWTKSDDSLFYLSYSEGFKSGGFNAVDDQNPVIDEFGVPQPTEPGAGFLYEDETAQSLALGGKHTLLDGAMTFNWELFSSEYDNQQVSTFVGLGFVVANAASSNVDGLEMDLLWQATDNLRLGANIALLDATYGSFPAAACNILQTANLAPATAAGATRTLNGCTTTVGPDGNSVVTQDLKGQPLSHAPDYSGVLFADYSSDFGNNGLQWYFNVDINFTDSYLLSGDGDPLDSQAGFEKINVRTGIRGENWEFMVYGKNITDELTASGGFDIPLAAGAHAQYVDPGEIYGARISFNF